MFKNLNAGAIGIRNKSLAETIVLAKESGFQGIDFDIKEAAQLAAAHGVGLCARPVCRQRYPAGAVGAAGGMEPGPLA